jgi:hypothetical protein
MPNDPDSGTNPSSEASPALDSSFELIERVRQGDRKSLERLVSRRLGPLRRFVSVAACPAGHAT